MYAASKAGTVGSGLMLLAAGIHSLDVAIFTRALAGFVFFVLTAPVAAHLVAKAAHAAGYRLTRLTVMDEMREPRERAAKKR
jgi:multicomponent Na+:H+ antiporter subunit G